MRIKSYDDKTRRCELEFNSPREEKQFLDTVINYFFEHELRKALEKAKK